MSPLEAGSPEARNGTGPLILQSMQWPVHVHDLSKLLDSVGLGAVRVLRRARPAGWTPSRLPGSWPQTLLCRASSPRLAGRRHGGCLRAGSSVHTAVPVRKGCCLDWRESFVPKSPSILFCSSRKGSDASWLVWDESSVQTLVRWHSSSFPMCGFDHREWHCQAPQKATSGTTPPLNDWWRTSKQPQGGRRIF